MHAISGWWLGASTSVAARRFNDLAQQAGGYEALARCDAPRLVQLGLEPDRAERWVGTPDGSTLGTPITRCDPRYPACIASDPTAPPLLFVQGELDALRDETPRVAVVGTRRCTGVGAQQARRLGHALSAAGVVVVSGLARGVDAEAHRGVLDAQGAPTVAVLGHGLGMTSPAGHRSLRRRILDGGGCVVSAWPDDAVPERWTFPARNRWIAGLATDVVVVEAGEGSGALITARDATELGRAVWIVPGAASSRAHRGALAWLNHELQRRAAAHDGLGRRALELLQRPSASARARLATAARVTQSPAPRLLFHSAQLVEAVTGCPTAQHPPWLELVLAGRTVDEVARTTGRPLLELLHDLGHLQLSGQLVALPGGRYSLRGSAST